MWTCPWWNTCREYFKRLRAKSKMTTFGHTNLPMPLTTAPALLSAYFIKKLKGNDVLVVVNKIVGTESVSCCCSVGHGPNKPHHIDTTKESKQNLGRHGGPRTQWLTDGNIARSYAIR